MRKDNSLVEEYRRGRETANSIFMKFISCEDFFYDYAFLFFEGEDGKYYIDKIKNYFDKYIKFPTGSKKEVLKLMNRINSDDYYDSVNKMFFVDRDCEISLQGKYNDLYETPCYSIENLYAQKSCFESILKVEFGLNVNDSDFKKIIRDFELRFMEFNQGMIEFNALLLLRRKKSDSNSNFQFGSIKTNHLYVSTILEVSKSNKYDNIISNIKDSLQLTNEEIKDSIEEIKDNGKYELNFRGKNQLDFFVAIINNLKELNINGTYFNEKLNGVKINITSNRLSELCQYAILPDCLHKFLENHIRS